ncbi:MAG: hypothetical protein HC852_18355 [Acaryochloridaceae cyanobacterium RU_4_10]|nr:hypothetical protein [Acaryochloridaceae cyanobacterium RU_4_10]
MNQKESKALWQTILGVLEVFAIDAIIVGIPMALGGIETPLVLVAAVFSLTQLIYIIPRGIYLYRKKKWPRFKGVVIGGVIAAFLNGGCWLYLISMMSNTHY